MARWSARSRGFFGGSPRPRCAPACARRAPRLPDGVARSRSSVPRSAGIPALLEQRGRARTRVGSRHESRSQHARPSLELDSKPEREMNGSHVCQGRLELPRPTRPGRSASEGGGTRPAHHRICSPFGIPSATTTANQYRATPTKKGPPRQRRVQAAPADVRGMVILSAASRVVASCLLVRRRQWSCVRSASHYAPTRSPHCQPLRATPTQKEPPRQRRVRAEPAVSMFVFCGASALVHAALHAGCSCCACAVCSRLCLLVVGRGQTFL